MSAESAFGLAGIVSIAGGMRHEKKWPKNGTAAVIATVALVLVASMFHGSKAEPIVKGIAYLTLLGAVYNAVPASRAKPATTKGKKP